MNCERMVPRPIRKLFLTLTLVSILAGGLFFFQTIAGAQPLKTTDLGLNQQVAGEIGLSGTDIRLVAARVIRAALGLLGIVAVALIIYAGYRWMTAGGNEEQIAEAKKIMVNAAIGLAIIFSAYAIVSFVISRLVAATTGAPLHCVNGIQDENEVGVDCGGDCAACPGPGAALGSLFYIDSLPGAGAMCIRNSHPVIVFNREVDIATLTNNAVLTDTGSNQTVSGTWQLGAKSNLAVFDPVGDCAPAQGKDCLAASTTYRLSIINPAKIKTLDGKLSLNCAVKAGCGPIEFTTGGDVDTLPPLVSIESPTSDTLLTAGATIPVTVRWDDDNGLQNLSLYSAAGKVKAGGPATLVASQSFNGCQRSGSVSFAWPTGNLASGLYTLESLGLDWAARAGSDLEVVTLRPAHCFDNVLDTDKGEVQAGPPACGGECGVCAGGGCADNAECASGWCEIPLGQTRGICLDKMRITDVFPLAASLGDYVTLAGYYFGDDGGKVYFARRNNPVLNQPADWVEAQVVSCGGLFDNWTNNQIIVEVPAGAVNGPLKVETKNTVGLDGRARIFVDATHDGWGPRLPDFSLIANSSLPGLCGVKPETGVPGDTVTLFGKNFGALDALEDAVWFGKFKALVNPNDWAPTTISPSVPNLDPGSVAIKVVNNGKESNGVRFMVRAGAAADRPIISGIMPDSGPEDQFIILTGKNFGTNLGTVWFKETTQSQAIFGVFPAACDNAGVWQPDQIIVKFPKGKGTIGKKYLVQINTNDNRTSPLDANIQYTLKAGVPAPGLCRLDPVSGPVPFPPGVTMKLSGEHFGLNPTTYFWRAGASSTATVGRVPGVVVNASDTAIEVAPPAAAITGPVAVYRPADQALSNGLNFTVLNCVKNNNQCADPAFRCCAVGAEAGFCKLPNELCAGETRAAGYVWRFATKDIPEIPRVIERCNRSQAELDAVNAGRALPSPSPSLIWNGRGTQAHEQVCRQALVSVEFSTGLDQTTVNKNSVRIFKCSALNGNVCQFPTPVELDAQSFRLRVAQTDQTGRRADFLQLQRLNGASWENDTWYQAVLSQSLKSAGTVTSSAPLSPDRPCDSKDIAGSAYCFTFKTDAADCELKTILVTPSSFWTRALEAPIKYRSVGGDEASLYFYGNGLSTQQCILMDMGGFTWQWASSHKTYADIYGLATSRRAQAAAKANTVGVNLRHPNNQNQLVDFVWIQATATTNTSQGPRSKTGASELTIDLSVPAVADWWPNCLEACPNAEVAVHFTTSLSTRNLPGGEVGGTVQLLKCNDENCFSTTAVTSSRQIVVDGQNPSILKIANALPLATPLSPNTLYQVIVSATSTDPARATNLIWSRDSLADPGSYRAPFNKVFTWRFRTKASACQIDRVAVSPAAYYAQVLNDRAVYQVQPFSTPDSCSRLGQRLDPWSVNWQWSSTDALVASTTVFSTRSVNPNCTAACVRKGSDVPAEGPAIPTCGNGVTEAGEDCDEPNFGKRCGLDCRFLGNPNPKTCGDGKVEPALGEACDPADPGSRVGCGSDCRRLGSSQTPNSQNPQASICGNGLIGSGEDCDLGIGANINDRQSALGCSAQCLHLGTRLAKSWCDREEKNKTYGQFDQRVFAAACAGSLSQCGDKVLDADEDTDCDGPGGWDSRNCNEFCLKKVDDSALDVTPANNCRTVPQPEGCSRLFQHTGSSLTYTTPSVCGDSVVGPGEDARCEIGLTGQGLIFNPWALVRGVGQGKPVPGISPPEQRAGIQAVTRDATPGGRLVRGEGQFIIQCGYKTDAECQAVSSTFGVGYDSCCYARPNVISTLPASSTPPAAPLSNVCPNTSIEVTFDQPIDPATLPGNFLIARGYRTNPNLAPPPPRPDGYLAPDNDLTRQAKLNGAYAVDVVFPLAYVTAHTNDALEIVDVSRPDQPTHRSVFTAGSHPDAHLAHPTDVVVRNNLAYVASYGSAVNPNNQAVRTGQALEIIDVSRSNAPTHVGFLGTDKENDKSGLPPLVAPSGLAVTGNLVLIADYYGRSFHVVDINSSINPRQVGALVHDGRTITTFEAPVKVAVSGRYAYLLSQGANSALNIIDIATPAAPRLVGVYRFRSSTPSDLEVVGNLAYIVNYGGNSLEIVDVASSTRPVALGYLQSGQGGNDAGGQARLRGATSVKVVGRYAFVSAQADQAFEIINIASSTRPVHAAVLTIREAPKLDNPAGVAVAGSYAYVAAYGAGLPNRGALQLIDVTDFTTTADCSQDVTSLIAAAFDRPAGPWYRRVWSLVAGFFRHWFGLPASAVVYQNPLLWCAGGDVGTFRVVTPPEPESAFSRVVVQLQKPLAKDTNYAVILKEGVRSARGVSIGQVGVKNINWRFNTHPVNQVCEVNAVTVEPPEWYFSAVGASTTLLARATTKEGGVIQPIPGFYSWEYLWGPNPNPYVAIGNTTSSLVTITAQNRNGEIDVRAVANVTENTFSASRGLVATGKSHVVVFLCENPWPPKNLFYNNQGPFIIFPYADTWNNNDDFDLASNTFTNRPLPPTAAVKDGYFNFSTYYCADAGNAGTMLDDLPRLRPVVQTTTTVVSASSTLKRFLFTNFKNSDAIGFQVFPNSKHLSPADWYASDPRGGGQGFAGKLQELTVDGYRAVSDGNNVYIDALNYASTTESLFTNIYLFSINADASAETRKVFEQLLSNLKFNVNLTNYGYCGAGLNNPGFATVCKTDFDCPAGQVCSVQTDKLKRNYDRLRGLNSIENALAGYAVGKPAGSYPELESGTYLTGQTISVWQSWPQLAAATGRGSLPVDPINQLGTGGTCASSTLPWAQKQIFCVKNEDCPNKPGTNLPDTCVLHDVFTGWSTADRRFSFACASSSLAYRYIFTTSTGYRLRARWEDVALPFKNLPLPFVADFVSTTRVSLFDPRGICLDDQEVVTINPGRCGDGMVNLNRGEDCDPPRKVRFGACSAVKPNVVQVDVCDAQCRWTPSTTPFVKCLTVCGNGLLEMGEACDDGKLNGRYNHCDDKCAGKVAAFNPVRPQDSPGFCGDGELNKQFELCDPTFELARRGYNVHDGWCVYGFDAGRACQVGIDSCGSLIKNSCVSIDVTRSHYDQARVQSCNFDCQSYGPYCGNGIVDSQFGEDCDVAADNRCEVARVSGQRECGKNCKFIDTAAAAWWRFDDGDTVSVKGKLFTYDSGRYSHTATCAVNATCPAFISPGDKIKNNFKFDGVSNYFEVADSPFLTVTTSLSVEAWVRPELFEPIDFPRVLEKGGSRAGGGYNLQFWKGRANFVVFGPKPFDQFLISSSSTIPLGRWTHLVGTYAFGQAPNGQTNQAIKIYVNGVEDTGDTYLNVGKIAGNVLVNVPLRLTQTNAPLYIGRSFDPQGYYFNGSIDEVRIYNRVLTPAEVLNHYESQAGGVCSVPPTAAVVFSPPGTCGDGRVDPGEACDNGQGFNGLACQPTYGKSCSYCSADCRSVIDAQPEQYCGNGKIEQVGVDRNSRPVFEVCDTDPGTGALYAAAADAITTGKFDAGHQGYEVLACSQEFSEPFVVKKGTKQCVSACTQIVTAETKAASCLRCGLSPTGVTVNGGLINVLDPGSVDPIYARAGDTKGGYLDLYLSSLGDVNKGVYVATAKNPARNYLLNDTTNQTQARLNPHALCSSGPEPNYMMLLNVDPDRKYRFPISVAPLLGQYDVVLSPVMSVGGLKDTRGERPSSVTPETLRLVVTWVGGDRSDLNAGFIIPGAEPPIQPTVEDTAMMVARGSEYYRTAFDFTYILYGIWYHDSGATAAPTNVEAMTVNTASMASSTYLFYVRTANRKSIAAYKNVRLKVDVYFPEDTGQSIYYNLFSRPSETFYVSGAAASENPNAPYWQVFNIRKPDGGGNPALKDRLIKVNKIKTEPKGFEFSLP